MNGLKPLFVVIAMGISIVAHAQFMRWEGPARWLPRTGATENFLYLQKDTTRVPEGAYTWEWVGPIDSAGRIEMVKIFGTVRKGLAEGDFQLIGYRLQSQVVGFDAEKAVVTYEGKRMRVTGKYTKGAPTGTWRWEEEDFPQPKVAPEVLTLVGEEWNFRGSTGSIRGKVNARGLMVGPWVIRQGAEQWETEYAQGILVHFKNYGDDNSYLAHQRVALAAADSVVASDPRSWTWTDGFRPTDGKWTMQQPMADFLNSAYRVYYWSEMLMAQNRWFNLPAIHGTGRLYFGLDNTQLTQLDQTLHLLGRKDTLLLNKLALPAFLLRRSTNPSLDSLMATTEHLYAQNQTLLFEIQEFLQQEARLVSPNHLGYSEAKNHRQVADILIKKGENFIEKASNLYQLLESKQESLRQLSAIEDLEEEWSSVLGTLEKWEHSLKAGTWAYTVWKQQVFNYLLLQPQRYADLSDPSEKKVFLQNVLADANWMMEFFSNHQERVLMEMPAKLKEAYTRWLYNPYMGVNNIEQIVKKKFYGNVQTQFWPQLMQHLENLPTVELFQAAFQEAVWLGEVLVHLGSDESAAATRMEKRGRNEKSISEMTAHLKEYAREAGLGEK